MGAAVHEVAPDAILAIHSPKVILNFHGGQPDALVIAAANQRGRERADRVASTYLAKMGIDAGLLALTRTIKFEDIHVLTRDEIARFGLDRRETVETSWRFESSALQFGAQDRRCEDAGRDLLQPAAMARDLLQFGSLRAGFSAAGAWRAPLWRSRMAGLARSISTDHGRRKRVELRAMGHAD